MQRWEYKILELDFDAIKVEEIDGEKQKPKLDLSPLLAQLGADGWEVTTSHSGYGGCGGTIILKRQIEHQVKSPGEV